MNRDPLSPVGKVEWNASYDYKADRRSRNEKDFIQRGLASRERARETGPYVEAVEVLATLDAKLTKARSDAS